MALLAAVIVLAGLLAGAASYASTPVVLVAAGLIGAWLAVFAVRERAARIRRRRSGPTRPQEG
ncbi:hypothetical protein [Peterkaempfera sp. SMS 1(5)a]|uniref:hypothetical protein n=1 Tax=Peterkaempfera podocarpi TaxID=3232308 RepID=UPI0036720B51